MSFISDAIDYLLTPADLLMPEPERASDLHPDELLGEKVWVRMYDSYHDELLCVVEDWQYRGGELWALFAPVNGRCERWRHWSCAVEVAQ